MSLAKVAEAATPITALTMHKGAVLAALTSGHIARLAPTGLQVVLDTHGLPRGLAVDPRSGELLIADATRHAVMKVESSDLNGPLKAFIESVVDTPLRAPLGIAVDPSGEVIVTDPGAFGDTGICAPFGTALRTIGGCHHVVPLAAQCLAYPAGVAVAANGAVYICELSANRLLRFVQHPAGIYHGSVFATFAGGMGPSAIAIDAATGYIYVAKYDVPMAAAVQQQSGTIVVLSADGDEVGRIKVPGSDINALVIDEATRSLYVAEGRTLHRMPLVA
jgi:DNA-binding beta-propeller fold protein YncE